MAFYLVAEGPPPYLHSGGKGFPTNTCCENCFFLSASFFRPATVSSAIHALGSLTIGRTRAGENLKKEPQKGERNWESDSKTRESEREKEGEREGELKKETVKKRTQGRESMWAVDGGIEKRTVHAER